MELELRSGMFRLVICWVRGLERVAALEGLGFTPVWKVSVGGQGQVRPSAGPLVGLTVSDALLAGCTDGVG